MVDRARRARFVAEEARRVMTWAVSIRKDVLMEATTLSKIPSALSVVHWYPYEAAAEEDGEYLFRLAFQRPRWGDVSISGGMVHSILCKQPAHSFDIPWAFEQG